MESHDRIIQEIIRGSGFSPEMARYFAAVSRHETGNYTSAVLERSNNLFGMKHPKIRKTLSRGQDISGYAVYNSPSDSVRDLVMYLFAQRYPFHVGSAANLVSLMKSKNYFEADLEEYTNGVLRALDKVENL